MSPFITVFFSLLLSLQSFSSLGSNGPDLIQDTCAKSAHSDPLLSYDFCVTSLQVLPKSHKANLQGLGVISAKLALANATHTKLYVEELAKNKTMDPYDRERLSSCLDLYSDAIPTLNDSVKAFKSKRYDDANVWVSAAMDASTTCEEGFEEEEGHVSPLTKENSNLYQLCAIALAITHLI